MSADVSLRAVVFADIAGYSRLMSEQNDRILSLVDGCLETAKQKCDAYGGDFVKPMGDGFIALFESALAAVEFATEIHRLTEPEASEDNTPIRFRIGIHLGEVYRGTTDVHGHAINIAARLEALARPGSTLISHDVYRLAREGGRFAFEDAGVPVLKNIRQRVSAYRVIDGPRAPAIAPVDSLSISVFGSLSVSMPGISLQLPRSKTLYGMLGCLALTSHHQVRQEKLIALLWPDRPQNEARRALGRILRLARQATAAASPDAIGNDADRVWLDDLSVTVDLDEMLANIRLGQVDDTLMQSSDWEDQIAPGLDRLGPLMRAWLMVARKHWRREFAIALEACIERFDPTEEGVRRAATALVNLEPGHEPASRGLIAYYISRGNRAAAAREYGRLASHLASNFGIEPAAETAELLSDFSKTSGQGAGDAPERSRRPSTIRKLQITVGDFIDFGGHEAHLVFGFRHELVANLSRFREWTVLEGGETEPALQAMIGEVRYTLEGYLETSTKDCHLVISLLEDSSRRVAWSDTFEISIASWHRLQRHVISRIAALLEVYMSADRLAHAITARADEAASFDAWLRGEQLLSRWTPEAEDKAAAIFECIIAGDPNFAPAYASLASIHNVRHVVRPGRPRDAEEDCAALQLGRRGVELDPLDARNHLAVAWTAALAGAFDQATVHLDLAVTLNPYSPRMAISAAMGYAWFGDAPRAVELLEHTLSITPMLLEYQWCYAASVWFFSADYEKALQASGRSGDIIADNQGWRAATLAQIGRAREAADAFARLVEEVTPMWAGQDPVTPEKVFEWFTTAYPIRREEDRARLTDALSAAMAGV